MVVQLIGGGRAEITIDSGAEESVCPYNWAPQFAVKPSQRLMRFRGANGNEIKHYGQKEIECEYPF